MKSNSIFLSLCVLFYLIPSRFIHVVTDGKLSFFFMAELFSLIYIFFIHSSVSGHLSYFYILAVVKKAAVNIEVLTSFELVVSFSSNKPRSGVAGSYGSYF